MENNYLPVFFMSNIPLSILQSDLMKEHKLDPALQELFQPGLHQKEMKNQEWAFCINMVLSRKQVICGEIRDPIQ